MIQCVRYVVRAYVVIAQSIFHWVCSPRSILIELNAVYVSLCRRDSSMIYTMKCLIMNGEVVDVSPMSGIHSVNFHDCDVARYPSRPS
jgi:hypothetical protein